MSKGRSGMIKEVLSGGQYGSQVLGKLVDGASALGKWVQVFVEDK